MSGIQNMAFDQNEQGNQVRFEDYSRVKIKLRFEETTEIKINISECNKDCLHECYEV